MGLKFNDCDDMLINTSLASKRMEKRGDFILIGYNTLTFQV